MLLIKLLSALGIHQKIGLSMLAYEGKKIFVVPVIELNWVKFCISKLERIVMQKIC